MRFTCGRLSSLHTISRGLILKTDVGGGRVSGSHRLAPLQEFPKSIFPFQM